MIDKDAIRSHFRHYTGQELSEKQKELSTLLKSAFYLLPSATYYQGLNSVMAFLHRNVGTNNLKLKDVLEIFIGMVNYHLSDFAHKEFDKCLVPVFNATARILNDKHPGVELQNLQAFVNMSTCAWVLTWFTSEADDVHNDEDTWRIWDYLLCSNPSQLIFFVAAATLHNYPANSELDPVEDLMELSQMLKKFVFTTEVLQPIIRSAKSLERYYTSSLDRADVINGCLLKNSMFFVASPRGIVSSTWFRYTIGCSLFVFMLCLVVYYSEAKWANTLRHWLFHLLPSSLRWFERKPQPLGFVKK